MSSSVRRSVRFGLPAALVLAVLALSFGATPASLNGMNASALCTYGPGNAPTVTGINPTSGSTAGGTVVTITGCGFLGATSVHFGATAGTAVTVNSDTSVTATSPAHVAAIVDVEVTTTLGTSAPTAADLFTYSTSPCTAVTLSAAPPSPQHAGATIVVTAQAFGCPFPLYQFWILAPGAAAWTLMQPYSSANTFNWVTSSPAGTYALDVWARDQGSAGTSGNVFGRWDTSAVISYLLTSPVGACAGVSLSAVPASQTGVGTAVNFTAVASGCGHTLPSYQFWALAPGASSWVSLQGYSTTATLHWVTAGAIPGFWRIVVWARDSGSGGTSSNTSGSWDAAINIPYSLSTCTGVTISAPTTTTGVGTAVTFTASASGCPNAGTLYQFWTLAPGASSWTSVQAYSTVATFHWTTSAAQPGVWYITVWAQDAMSGGASGNAFGRWDVSNSFKYTLTTCTSVNLGAAPSSPRVHGTTILFTATAMGCPNAGAMYQFWVRASTTSTWSMVQVYSTSGTFSWNTSTAAAGTYYIDVWAKDAMSAGAFSNISGSWDVAAVSTFVLT